MKVHVLQHVPFEGLGHIASWLERRKADVGFTRFFEDPALPPPAGLDLVVAMGGPMSVNDEAALPWLRAEKQFVRRAAEDGVAVLGICLGAQLIANAFGGRVYPNAEKEIGWFEIEAAASSGDGFRFPPRCMAFHWHGETFDLPAGAARLARSAACENQAFQWGRRVIGLQFHLESTPEAVRVLVEHGREELQAGGRRIQSAAEIAGAGAASFEEMHALMDRLLVHLTGVK